MSQPNEVINSHVQITKGLMKGFSYNGKKIWYLDVDSGNIQPGEIKILGTEKKYYSHDIEKELARVVETPFGDIAKLYKDFCKSKFDSFQMTTKAENDILRFFYYSMLRSKLLPQKASVVLGYDVQPDEIIIEGKKRFEESPFASRRISVSKNLSKRGYVLPSCCYYAMPYENDGINFSYVMPVSSSAALVAHTEEEYDKHICVKGEESIRHGVAASINVIDYMNKSAYLSELASNKDFVVARKKADLEALL